MANGTTNGAATQQTGAETGVLLDPFRAYNFKVMIQGTTEAHFTTCEGLEIKVEPIRYREGGIQQVVRAIPGFVDYGSVTLRYGVTSSAELWNWFMTGVQGRVERKNISILMLDADGVAEVMRFDLVNAWASEWKAARLDALTREIAIESLTLVFETLQRA